MNNEYEIETPRLGLRRWRQEDRVPFAEMNADPQVMQYYPDVLTRTQSDAFVDAIENHFSQHGYGLWAVDLKRTVAFIGYIGFYTATFDAPFTPCVEIGWRLAQAHWSRGYATEGAKACLRHGFETLRFQEVYSFTSAVNRPSIRVMQKIGLKKAGTFDHPSLPPTSPLRPHVLFHAGAED